MSGLQYAYMMNSGDAFVYIEYMWNIQRLGFPLISQVFKTGWWMAHYGAPSPKREKIFSNNPTVGKFCRGKLTKAQRSKLTLKTTKRTAKGGYQGTKELKSTQPLSHTVVAKC